MVRITLVSKVDFILLVPTRTTSAVLCIIVAASEKSPKRLARKSPTDPRLAVVSPNVALAQLRKGTSELDSLACSGVVREALQSGTFAFIPHKWVLGF